MSKFITGKELEDAVYNIIWDANRHLMLVSPYIRLDAYFKKLFDAHLNKPKLHILVIFGKNVGQVDRSLNKPDLEFFLQFPNISMVYAPDLHAKYYANDSIGVLTSINLYDHSFKNNIEYGVLFEAKGLSSILAKNPDSEVWETSLAIANRHEVVFIKRPVFEKGFLSKDYMGSKVMLDRTEELYSGSPLAQGKLKLDDFPEELNANDYTARPVRAEVDQRAKKQHGAPHTNAAKPFEAGFCIRTGAKIPFNPKQPFSYPAYQSWSKFSNQDYPEKYCHYSGEPSEGKTSFNRPILHKNWRKAQQV